MPTLEVTRDIVPAGFQDDLDVAVEDAFAWQDVIANIEDAKKADGALYSLANKALYLVVFESERADDADPAVIAELDRAAHGEAARLKPENLLHYFDGTPDADGRSRSWCLWTDDESAREAVAGPKHQEARSRAPEIYKHYAVKLFSVIPHDEGIVFVPHFHPTNAIRRGDNA